jgi:adenine-specific DNA-methyltransferase
MHSMPTIYFRDEVFVYLHHLSVPFRELVLDVKKSLPVAGVEPSLEDNLIHRIIGN